MVNLTSDCSRCGAQLTLKGSQEEAAAAYLVFAAKHYAQVPTCKPKEPVEAGNAARPG